MGKFFCSIKMAPKFPTLIPGSTLVVDIIEKKSGSFTIESIDSISYPAIQTSQELTWLHHILELYYFYLPEHQANPYDFDFLIHYLTLMQQHPDQKNHLHLQQLAVSHFLAQTGFYEQPALHRYAKIFEEVIDQPTTSGVPFFLVGSEEVSMRDLILRCLQEHPEFHKFRTIPFLYGACAQ
jgi:hypothetical protein